MYRDPDRYHFTVYSMKRGKKKKKIILRNKPRRKRHKEKFIKRNYSKKLQFRSKMYRTLKEASPENIPLQ